jgi:hypothetical protein
LVPWKVFVMRNSASPPFCQWSMSLSKHWTDYWFVFIDENFRLSGSVPTQIGLLSNLEEFTADQCNFTGTIPSQIGVLSLLENFALGESRLLPFFPISLILNYYSYLQPRIIFLEEFPPRWDCCRIWVVYIFPSMKSLVQSQQNSVNWQILVRESIHSFDALEFANLSLITAFLSCVGYAELQESLLTGTVPDEVCAMRSSSLKRLIVDCIPKPDTGLIEIECVVPDCCTECH